MQNELFQDSEGLDQLLEHMGDAEQSKHRWPQLLADIVDVMAEHFKRRRKLADEDAAVEAIQVVTVLAHYFGGRLTYLPKDEKLRLAVRDNLIWQEFKGPNLSALAKKYNLTEMQLYNIIREQRSLHVERVQPDLFNNRDA